MDKKAGTDAGTADGSAGNDAADNSAKTQIYQDAYTAAYTSAKAAYDAAHAAKPATGIVASQATFTGKADSTKDFTLKTDPEDATDSDDVLAATTVVSSDETVAKIVKNEDGTYTGTIVGEGSATFDFTSGAFTYQITVTGQAAS